MISKKYTLKMNVSIIMLWSISACWINIIIWSILHLFAAYGLRLYNTLEEIAEMYFHSIKYQLACIVICYISVWLINRKNKLKTIHYKGPFINRDL